MNKKTTEQFKKDLIKKWGIPSNSFELLTPYEGYDQDILFKCKKCGQEKKVKASVLLSKKGNKKHICRCYSYSLKWQEEMTNFRKWENEQNSFLILEDFKGIKVNLLVKCKKCGAMQRRSPYSLTRGDGCLVCEKKCSIPKTEAQVKKELNELYGGEYELVKGYTNVTTSALFRHTLCGKIYSTQPHYLLTNKGGHCPICKTLSKGEKIIFSLLINFGISFETQKRLEGLKRCPYDFFIPSKNLLIEFQGIQHFQPVKKFGGEKSFLRQQEVDKQKAEYAIAQGYELLIIPYTEIANMKSILVQRLSLGRE